MKSIDGKVYVGFGVLSATMLLTVLMYTLSPDLYGPLAGLFSLVAGPVGFALIFAGLVTKKG